MPGTCGAGLNPAAATSRLIFSFVTAPAEANAWERFFRPFHPRLGAWAAFFRRFAATISVCGKKDRLVTDCDCAAADGFFHSCYIRFVVIGGWVRVFGGRATTAVAVLFGVPNDLPVIQVAGVYAV